MLAGALFGVEAIPRRWLERLDEEIKSEIEYQTRELLKGKY
jgi:ADP-ribosylglycohydrolase